MGSHINQNSFGEFTFKTGTATLVISKMSNRAQTGVGTRHGSWASTGVEPGARADWATAVKDRGGIVRTQSVPNC